jgi:hypothetical protein
MVKYLFRTRGLEICVEYNIAAGRATVPDRFSDRRRTKRKTLALQVGD